MPLSMPLFIHIMASKDPVDSKALALLWLAGFLHDWSAFPLYGFEL